MEINGGKTLAMADLLAYHLRRRSGGVILAAPSEEAAAHFLTVVVQRHPEVPWDRLSVLTPS